MNEIAGIFIKTDKIDLTDFSAKAVLFFKEKFAGLTSEYLENNIILLSASKTNKKREIQEYNEHITALGGYLLNEPEATNLNKYDLGLFHGKFLFVHINKIERITKIYNDMLGHFPVFYYESQDLFCFSSDLSFLLCLDIDKTISKQHVADYFFWGSTLPSTTFFENISLLTPASEIIIDDNSKLKFNNYNVESKSYDFKNINEAAETLTSVMQSVIKSYYDYYGKLNFTLTGGLDTRYIASLINPDWDVEFVTVADRYVNDDENNDIIIAKKIAKRLSIKHNIVKSDLFPVPKDFNKDYFKTDLINDYSNPPYVSGIYGSELLKLQVLDIVNNHFRSSFLKRMSLDYPYPTYYSGKNNFSYVNFRKDINSFTRIFKPKEKTEYKSFIRRRFKKGIESINQYPMAFLFDELTGVYLSNYYGGSRGGWVNPVNFHKTLLVPFIDQKVYSILISMNPSYFGLNTNSIYYVLYKDFVNGLNDIETNSVFAFERNSDLLKYASEGKETIPFRQNNDDKLLSFYLNESKLLNIKLFNNKSLRRNIIKYKWYKHLFIDLSVWLDYVDSFNSN